MYAIRSYYGEWRPADEDWKLPENWKEILLEGIAERLEKYRSFRLFMDICVRFPVRGGIPAAQGERLGNQVLRADEGVHLVLAVRKPKGFKALERRLSKRPQPAGRRGSYNFV